MFSPAQRDALLTLNRLVWMLALAAWSVVLLAGAYLEKVHLHALGAVSLALTSGLGFAYVLTSGNAGSRTGRWLGILANALLIAEFAFELAVRSPRPGAQIALGAVLVAALLGLPLAVLLADLRDGRSADS